MCDGGVWRLDDCGAGDEFIAGAGFDDVEEGA